MFQPLVFGLKEMGYGNESPGMKKGCRTTSFFLDGYHVFSAVHVRQVTKRCASLITVMDGRSQSEFTAVIVCIRIKYRVLSPETR